MRAALRDFYLVMKVERLYLFPNPLSSEVLVALKRAQVQALANRGAPDRAGIREESHERSRRRPTAFLRYSNAKAWKPSLRKELADVREGMHSVLHALIDSKHVSLREKAVLELLQSTGARLHEVVQVTVGGYQNEGIAGQALVVNKGSQFQGGQDARDFTTVTQADIDRPTAMLKAQVAQSMQAALGQQLAPGEQLQKAPCAPAVAADPAIGQEASSVRVTVSETCSGYAYNSQQLTARGAKLLTAQALRLLGNGYARFGNITVSVTKAAIEGQTASLPSPAREPGRIESMRLV